MTEFDKVIPPGGVGKVTASLDTSHYRGPISKAIMVSAIGAGLPPVQLELKADVVAQVDIAPTEQPMFNMMAGEPTPMDLVMTTPDGKPFDILTLRGDPNFDATIRPDPPPRKGRPAPKTAAVAAGAKRYVLTLTPHKDVPVGQRVGTIVMTTNRAKAETLTIRPFLVVTGRVQVTPEQLLVRPGPVPPVLHLRLKKTVGTGLKIIDVASSDPDFTIATTTVADAREYDVAITCNGKSGRGVVNARITVTTNEPGQEHIVVPIGGQL